MSTEPTNALAVPDDDTGLGDFDESDIIIPRLTIEMETAEFKDSLSGERFAEMEVIALGLVKQRILWPAEMSPERSDPLCKSLDSLTGNPGEKFPWEASGFDKAEQLPCESCPLKEWGSHPTRDTPWCTEQHVLPLLMPSGNGGWAPALLTLQRSSIKPSRAYMSSFARSKTPLYTTTTKIKLNAQKRGSVNYAVIEFTKGSPTDQADWPDYAGNFRSIRQFLHTPRREDTEAEASAPAASAPAASAAASEDDLPF